MQLPSGTPKGDSQDVASRLARLSPQKPFPIPKWNLRVPWSFKAYSSLRGPTGESRRTPAP
eukprot:5570193-Pyramimonas_sp.AAC.1